MVGVRRFLGLGLCALGFFRSRRNDENGKGKWVWEERREGKN